MDVTAKAFGEALAGFDYLVHVDIDALGKELDPRLIDGLKNGVAQKFEYTVELCWKALKVTRSRKQNSWPLTSNN
ncbi:MAG: hypothetical protein ACREX9_17640 [Gammaproteobacteria bacterium]